MIRRAVLLNDTRSDLHHGCELVFRTIDRELREKGISLSATSPANSDWWKNASILSEIKAADLVIVNGEGTIHDDSRAGAKLLKVSRICRELNIPSALINCTWANNSPEFKAMATDFDLLAVRDSESARQLAGGGESILVVPDLSLGSLKRSYDQGSEQSFGDSVLRDVSVLINRRRMEQGGAYLPIQFPSEQPAGTWRFIRSMLSKHDVSDPAKLYRYIHCRVNQLMHAVRDTDEFVARVSKAGSYLTGRYHGICIALGAGTPFVALDSNSHKVASLLKDAKLGHRVISPEGFDSPATRRLAHWTPVELRRLESFLRGAKESRQELFRRLNDLACLTRGLRST